MTSPDAPLTPVQIERFDEHRRRFTRPVFWLEVGLLLALILAPFSISSVRVMDVITKVMILTVAVASYDLIIGYTGIVTFAHGMFFGIGAYSLGVVLNHASQPVPAKVSFLVPILSQPQIAQTHWLSVSPHYLHLLIGLVIAIVLAAAVALLIVLFSLRVKAIFFAMISLAFAEFAFILGQQWRSLTGAGDGLAFKLPGIFAKGWSGGQIMAAEINYKLFVYFVILALSVALFMMMFRLIRSPLGRVIKATRENEPRATALGYKTFRFQATSFVIGCVIAAVCGWMYAFNELQLDAGEVLGIGLMLNILLMVIIGGLGTLWGSIIGVAFVKAGEAWLPDLGRWAVKLVPSVPILERLAERWLLWFGLLFVLMVIFFPQGVVGTARDLIGRAKLRAAAKGS
jgi:branched-chain amino acid transport system permease protein